MRLSVFLIFFLVACSRPQSFEDVKRSHPSSFREISDRKGDLIHETRVNFKRQRRSWTSLKDLPSEFINEVVTLEDQRFFHHHGVDSIAMMSALKEYPKRGASTITMQLAGLLQKKSGRRNLSQKISQAIEAIKLEQYWSKEEILEAWINLLTYKGEFEGIRAASFSLFHKDPRGLNLDERLLLYSQIPSPNQSVQSALKRACRYAHRLKKNCNGLSSIIHQTHFSKPQTDLQQNHAPHFAFRLRNDTRDHVPTTLDGNLQKEAFNVLRSHIKNLRTQNVKDGAVIVLDRKTGNVLAYVGSSGDLSSSPLVDHIQSLRQAGSTLKPLLYASAISERLITMTTPLRDEPFSVTREGLTYQPENYQKGFTFQDVPAKVALGSSLNIPAVRVIDYLTPEKFYYLLSDLKFRSLKDPGYYGHSMALGSVDITLWDLAHSYLALADSTHKTLTPEISFIIAHILSEKNNRHLTFGIQSTLSTESWSAVKTGTSKDMRDNWCIGFTDQYVIGVWVGNSHGDSMWNVTGISGAAPVFSHLVSYLHQERPSQAPTPPKTLIRIDDDYYLPGTEPKGLQDLALSESSVTKIVFPQNGAQFAFDPEIPEKNQKILFQASGTNLRWKLNGHQSGGDYIPRKSGKHLLELIDEHNETKDKVIFYVKSGQVPL